MDNKTISNIMDGLTSRGVLSADGRRQVFSILLQQAKEHEQVNSLLKEELANVRNQRDLLNEKLQKARSLLPRTKLAELDG